MIEDEKTKFNCFFYDFEKLQNIEKVILRKRKQLQVFQNL